jgi:hypothetical protein
MLKVKSFKISDDAAINELLSKYRIAKNAQILVSEGNVMIPYEDGEALSGEPLKNLYLEIRNDEILKVKILEQAQAGLVLQLERMSADLKTIDASLEETAHSKDSRNLKDSKKVLENKINQLKAIIDNNKHEKIRIDTNVEAIDQLIKTL